LQRNSKVQDALRDLLAGGKQEQNEFELTLKQLAEMGRVGKAGNLAVKTGGYKAA